MSKSDETIRQVLAHHSMMQEAVPDHGRHGHTPIVLLAYLHLHGPSLSKPIEEALGITQTTVGRAAAFLRDGKCAGRDDRHSWGGAISTSKDPADPRRSIHSITSKGRRLLRDAVAQKSEEA